MAKDKKPEQTPKPPQDKAAGEGAEVNGGGDRGLYASFTTSKGNTFYAKDYGYKAWPIGKRTT